MKFSLLVKQAIAITLVTLSLFIQTFSGAFAADQLGDNMLFKQLTDQTYAAWNTQNPDAVAKFYLNDPNLVIYDATPLKYKGWDDFKAGIQTHLFDKLNRFKLVANNDLEATHYGDLVLTTFTYHLSAESKTGELIEAEGRQTDLWQKEDDRWLIIHEHTSAPVSL
ncbi:MAG: nuclear transport factor 2 family protein [Leptolyngbya sp. SIO1E4]|nr:nuclear transport factor 2 family protein [Leptolyngbya sp. SIO1E4]